MVECDPPLSEARTREALWREEDSLASVPRSVYSTRLSIVIIHVPVNSEAYARPVLQFEQWSG